MEPQSNPLLVRPQVGKSRPPTFDLPTQHTYGKKNIKDPFGAGSLVSDWNEH